MWCLILGGSIGWFAYMMGRGLAFIVRCVTAAFREYRVKPVERAA